MSTTGSTTACSGTTGIGGTVIRTATSKSQSRAGVSSSLDVNGQHRPSSVSPRQAALPDSDGRSFTRRLERKQVLCPATRFRSLKSEVLKPVLPFGLIKEGEVPGVQAQEDDLILDLEQILPPPHIEGNVVSVRIEGEKIIQIFGDPDSKVMKNIRRGNYMADKTSRLRFNKLVMNDVDLTSST